MTEVRDKAIMKAAEQLSSAIQGLIDNEDDYLLDMNETCIALENLCCVTGVEDLKVRKLRKELQKRGLRKARS